MHRIQPVIQSIKQTQQGVVLIVGLIILMVMSLIGIAGMQSTTMEEKMAGNMRDQSVAFQSAETALRVGELFLGSPILPAFSGSNGYYQPAEGASASVWKRVDWSDSSQVVTVSDMTLADTHSNPVYIIEELAQVVDSSGSLEAALPKTSTYFRVTARATGSSTTSQVVLQSVFKR
jgi:type IV pilus assembly protein PilX